MSYASMMKILRDYSNHNFTHNFGETPNCGFIFAKKGILVVNNTFVYISALTIALRG